MSHLSLQDDAHHPAGEPLRSLDLNRSTLLLTPVIIGRDPVAMARPPVTI